ncbi:MAG: glycosyltransferase family 2 protein [Acidobacteriota bacterium]
MYKQYGDNFIITDVMAQTITIIMPVYNEEDCIEQVIKDIDAAVLSKLDGSELLVIDDGSTDSTTKILDNLAGCLPSVFPLHKDNGGHGDALRYGLDHAEGEFLFLMDSDGQVDPEDFWLLWKKRHEAAFICGNRSKRDDPIHRLVLSRLLRYGIRLLFGLKCRDANVPFKLMTKSFWKRARPFIPEKTLTPSLFLSLLAHRLGEGVEEIEIRHLSRKTGACHIRYFNLFRFSLRSLFQLLEFRWKMGRKSKKSWKSRDDA